MIKILFVCTGNICRSPTAEAVFRRLVVQEGKELEFEIDSAGTHGYHVGDPPDMRAVKVAEKQGISMEGIRARKVNIIDFEEFDIICAMDKGHYDFLESMMPACSRANLKLFMDFSSNQKNIDVPDPYYGTEDGFIKVVEMLKDGAKGILNNYF